jgi:hypothetical protein
LPNSGNSAAPGQSHWLYAFWERLSKRTLQPHSCAIEARARRGDQKREPKRFVTLPFDFVVGGKTLPAGTYRLSLLADDKCEGTILGSCENRISVFVHPVEIESTFAERPHLSFERVGEERFLSRIQTTDDVYNIRVFHSLIMEAAAKTRDNGSASGSSGSK